MKIHITHIESIKSFEDIEHHLFLEDESRDTFKATDQAFLAEFVGTILSKSTRTKKHGRKRDLISQIIRINLNLRREETWC